MRVGGAGPPDSAAEEDGARVLAMTCVCLGKPDRLGAGIGIVRDRDDA